MVWRWFDAVVTENAADGSVLLWEPGRGEVRASARGTYVTQRPGGRAFISAGLPGAEWWVAADVDDRPESAAVELEDVVALYVEYGMWQSALAFLT